MQTKFVLIRSRMAFHLRVDKVHSNTIINTIRNNNIS